MRISAEDQTLLEGAGATLVAAEQGEAIATALVEQGFPWAGILDPLVVWLQAETAELVTLVRAGPLVGALVVFREEGTPELICRTVAAYVDAVRTSERLPESSLIDPDGPRTEADERAAQHLVANAFDEEDWTALALAIPLVRENVGLLAQLARVESVAELARARVERVAGAEVLRAVDAGRGPAAWHTPDELCPQLETELEGWTRTQLGFADAVVEGVLRVVRGDTDRTLVLAGPVNLTALLDDVLPGEPADTSFLEDVGAWASGVPTGELRWSDEGVQLKVGTSTLVEWTRQA